MPDRPSPATGRIARHVRAATIAALLACAAGCGGADADAPPLTAGDSSAGAGTAASRAVADDVTSEDYRKWLVAQQALDRIPNLELPSRVSLREFDDADVARVEDYLEGNPQARAAIEGAGLDVKEYVRTSVALERSMALAQGEPAAPAAPASDVPAGDAPLLRAPLPGADDPTFQRVWAGRRLRVVEADEDEPADRRWRDHDDSESRRDAKRLEKARKRQAKAWGKRERHGKHGRH